MAISILVSALSFEIGSLFGFGASKFGTREKNQNVLIEGYSARTTIPIADKHIEKQTIGATRAQRMIADRLARIVRAFVNTKTFDLLVLQKVREFRQPKELDSKVNLFI